MTIDDTILPSLTPTAQEMFEPNSSPTGKSSPGRWTSWLRRTPASDSSASSTMSRSLEDAPLSAGHDKSIASLCESMRRQILCRAFYGWLTHTRHIRTVRNHLSELVCPRNDQTEEMFAAGLDKQMWDSMHDEKGRIPADRCPHIHSSLYFGGCEPSIRPAVWPYLLNHYEFGMTQEERKERDTEMQQHYEITMTEWLAIEVIVKQRDKEIAAANLAKLSSESTAESTDLTEARNGSNDVFFEAQNEDESKGGESRARKEIDCDRKIRISRQKQLESKGSQTVTDLILEEDEVSEEQDRLTANPDPDCPSPTSSNGGVYSVSRTSISFSFSTQSLRIMSIVCVSDECLSPSASPAHVRRSCWTCSP